MKKNMTTKHKYFADIILHFKYVMTDLSNKELSYIHILIKVTYICFNQS